MDDAYVTFKEKHTLESRKDESSRIIKKFPNRIPIIVERKGNNSNIPYIDKNKFLTPNDLTFGQFVYVIRKRLHVSSEIGLFYFVNNKMFTMSDIIAQVYTEEKDEDGFLYINYCGENTFG